MKLKNRAFLLLLFLIGNVCVFAQGVNYVGTSSANFLKIGIGAKNAGTGESDITDAADASILYWNPGAISRLSEVSLSVSYLDWLVGSNMANLSCTVPLGFVTAGLDITYFTSGDIEETTLADQDGTGRFFSATDIALGLTLAKNITDRFSVGLKVKYLSESLSSVSSSAVAFDIGSVF
ncbi:MAG: PorV/PorQ family protein, partial [Ignavibacteriaceae bacterium]